MIKESIPMAIEGKIILFGINPDRPDPGLGYMYKKIKWKALFNKKQRKLKKSEYLL